MKRSFLSVVLASTMIINGPVLAVFEDGKDEVTTVGRVKRMLDAPGEPDQHGCVSTRTFQEEGRTFRVTSSSGVPLSSAIILSCVYFEGQSITGRFCRKQGLKTWNFNIQMTPGGPPSAFDIDPNRHVPGPSFASVDVQEIENTGGGESAAPIASAAPVVPVPAPAAIVAEENPYTILYMPLRTMATGDRDHYVYRCPQRNLWVQIERLTPEAKSWWKRRLGFEAQMQLGREIELNKSQEASKSLEQRAQDERAAAAYGCDASTFPSHLREGQSWIPFMTEGESPEETAARMASKEFKDFETLCTKYPPEFNGPMYSYMSSPMYYYVSMAPVPTPRKSVGYVGAWRGFVHNLCLPNDDVSWVACVTSRPFDGPLHASGASVMSPDILMAMTVRNGETFYSPLGIYGSPIAAAHALEQGKKPPKNLSLFFHASVAHLMGQINPNSEYMTVRALEKMGEILMKSGIPFSSTAGWRRDDSLPHIHYNDGQRYGGELDRVRNMIFGKEMTYEPSIPYALVDPRTMTVHRIPVDHWFTQHPFLGGSEVRNDLSAMSTFPYMTADRLDLEAYLAHEGKKESK